MFHNVIIKENLQLVVIIFVITIFLQLLQDSTISRQDADLKISFIIFFFLFDSFDYQLNF